MVFWWLAGSQLVARGLQEGPLGVRGWFSGGSQARSLRLTACRKDPLGCEGGFLVARRLAACGSRLAGRTPWASPWGARVVFWWLAGSQLAARGLLTTHPPPPTLCTLSLLPASFRTPYSSYLLPSPPIIPLPAIPSPPPHQPPPTSTHLTPSPPPPPSPQAAQLLLLVLGWAAAHPWRPRPLLRPKMYVFSTAIARSTTSQERWDARVCVQRVGVQWWRMGRKGGRPAKGAVQGECVSAPACPEACPGGGTGC